MPILSNLFVKLGLKSSDFNKGIDSAGKKTSAFGKGVTKIGGMIAGAFAVTAIVAFGKELLELGGIAEGVRSAFFRIADRRILDDLTEATAGTVSELALMKRAVMAHNFKIPMEQLASLFQFATKRAQETGESVDFLVNSIVLGIGRKSPLILDNLGISAVSLRKKLKGVGTEGATVGDVAKAVGEIATDAMRESGDIIETNAIKLAQLTTQWENFKLALATDESVQTIMGKLLEEAQDFINLTTKFQTTKQVEEENEARKKAAREESERRKAAIELNNLFGQSINDLTQTEIDAAIASAKSSNEAFEARKKAGKLLKELKDETEALTASLDLYGTNQEAEIQKTLKQIAANKELIKTLTSIKHGQEDVPSQIEGIGAGTFGSEIDQPTGLGDMTSFIAKNKEQQRLDVQSQNVAIFNQEQEFIEDMNALMEGGVEDFVATFAEGIGRLASGDIGMDDFFNVILEAIGGFLGQMGKMLIAYGFAMEAFKNAFSNPFVAIAAGVALVAIGGAISGLASKGPAGAGSVSGGGGIGASGYNTQARADSNNTVTFELQGTKLVGVLNNVNRRNSIIG